MLTGFDFFVRSVGSGVLILMFLVILSSILESQGKQKLVKYIDNINTWYSIFLLCYFTVFFVYHIWTAGG